MVYMDRHNLNCGGNNNVITMFKMERNGRKGSKIRFKYRCCQFSGSVCTNTLKYTGFNKDGGGDTVYLDRHYVTCPNTGYLNDFKIERNSQHTQVVMNSIIILFLIVVN